MRNANRTVHEWYPAWIVVTPNDGIQHALYGGPLPKIVRTKARQTPESFRIAPGYPTSGLSVDKQGLCRCGQSIGDSGRLFWTFAEALDEVRTLLGFYVSEFQSAIEYVRRDLDKWEKTVAPDRAEDA